jgi:hypothetical protein
MPLLRKPSPEISAPEGQSRAMSLVESIANVVVGFSMAVATQMAVFPLFGICVTLSANLAIGAVFTITSIARSYLLRRLFEHLRLYGVKREAAALRRTAATIGMWVGQLPMR